jgi:predicted transcriptional regulator
MNSATVQQPTQSLQEKWGAGLDGGFLLIPVLLLKRQQELSLDNTEVIVLMHLLAAWWDKDKRPYPRASTIATRMGLTARTVQRSLQSLEKKEMIVRVKHTSGFGKEHHQATSYHMQGTVDRVRKLAEVAHQNFPQTVRVRSDDLIDDPASVTSKGEKLKVIEG